MCIVRLEGERRPTHEYLRERHGPKPFLDQRLGLAVPGVTESTHQELARNQRQQVVVAAAIDGISVPLVPMLLALCLSDVFI